jgi:hypothetical protein
MFEDRHKYPFSVSNEIIELLFVFVKKLHFSGIETNFLNQNFILKYSWQTSKMLHLDYSFIWTLWAVGHKNLESLEVWCWRRMEKISWTNSVRNEEVLLRVKKQRNILHEISKRKANWIGHILRRNCLQQYVIVGKIKGMIEVRGRRGRRRRKVFDDLKERRGYSHLKEKALDRLMWRARFENGFGPVMRQTAK